jgi:predicted Ser/Thr protein kinase
VFFMATANAHTDALLPEETAALHALLADFARDWRDGLLSEASGRLSQRSVALRRAALIAMVEIDLSRQWRQGRRPTLENYLESYPDLGGAHDVPAQLIEAELAARAAAGEAVEAGAVLERFPARAAELGTLVARDDTRLDAAALAPARPANPTPSAVPEQFGRYRIQRRLGRGAMGAVYLALDTELHRQVALKIPSAEASNDPSTAERFMREARAAAALRHPNICPVYDVGRHEDKLYLTMAYIEGRTLHDVLKAGGPPPQAEAAALVRKLALALEVAHRRGLLHRDLKPSNVMIDPAGEPVVMDFGLVRSTEAGGDLLTQIGAILGTPAYMAPEQALSELEKLGPTADVYSAGVILYQMLAGRLPFTGNVHGILLQKINEEPPPPSAFRPDIDGRLEAICLKAMAKEPADRFPAMAALAAALESWMPGSSTAATPTGGTEHLSATTTGKTPSTSPRLRPKVSRVVAAAVVAVLSVGIIAVLLTGSRQAAPGTGMHPAEGNKAAAEGRSSPGRDTGGPGVRPAPARGGGDNIPDLIDIGGDSPRAKGPNSPEKTSESRTTIRPGSALHGRE